MKKTSLLINLLILAGVFLFEPSSAEPGDKNLSRAQTTLKQIFSLYDAGHDHLLNETFPYKVDKKVTNPALEVNENEKHVAYLWPASGVFSAVNALLETTGEQQYIKMLETKILPGLQQYYDSVRKPSCYQSYIISAGHSDRYYDDNIWLALDFSKSYWLTQNPEYLNKSVEIWKFVISGWDNQLGGGIYWCEQKKGSKNTCSNAPASVLALKLFEATKDTAYLNMGVRIYSWTKANLQDSSDYLYFDNKTLMGRIDHKKYTYNSGQMLQAAALLYKLTGKKQYLKEAHQIAKSAIQFFTEDFTTPEGRKIRLFKNGENWFNAVLLRGYRELYQLDKNKNYLTIFEDNLDLLWNVSRDKNGLFRKNWKGNNDDEYKWLLDQASMVEMWATLAEFR
jgi:hypothetical protein